MDHDLADILPFAPADLRVLVKPVLGLVQPLDAAQRHLDAAAYVEFARVPEPLAEFRDHFHPDLEDFLLGQVPEQFTLDAHFNSMMQTRPDFSIQRCESS